MTPKSFHALLGRIGARAKMPFPIHPHMLRHGCGYALANAGHDTRSLQPGSGKRIFSTPCAIPSYRRIGSSGAAGWPSSASARNAGASSGSYGRAWRAGINLRLTVAARTWTAWGQARSLSGRSERGQCRRNA